MPFSKAGEQRESLIGLSYGFAAYFAWGLLPLYWKTLEQVPAFEILCHRIVWSTVFLLLLLRTGGRWGKFRKAIRDPRTILILTASTLAIGANWFVYIWAVNSGHVLETSLGYFINPILSVILAVAFLKERLRPLQTCSVALATVGVLYLNSGYGQFPWIAMALACSFGIYGLLRKIAPVGALTGLAVETFILTGPCLLYLLHLESSGNGVIFTGDVAVLWVLLAGPVTCIPLLWFTAGARRLKLSTIGLIQYLAPSMQFLLAVFYFGEPFTSDHLVSFCLIWAALILFSGEALWVENARRRERR